MSTPKPSAEELTGARFVTSTFSGPNGNECVAVATIRGWACVRDSKLADSPTLTLSGPAFTQALAALSDGTL
ncbi:hypothetical protein ACVW0K_007186 [Streptomyces filamentosus]